MTAEGDEPRDDHHNEYKDLEHPEEILQPESPFQGTSMEQKRECDARETNETERPSTGGLIGCQQNVFAEYERISSCPS